MPAGCFISLGLVTLGKKQVREKKAEHLLSHVLIEHPHVPARSLHSVRTGSYGQGNIYVHSSRPLGSKAQITKSCTIQMTAPKVRSRKSSVALEMGVTRYDVFFFFFSTRVSADYWHQINPIL